MIFEAHLTDAKVKVKVKVKSTVGVHTQACATAVIVIVIVIELHFDVVQIAIVPTPPEHSCSDVRVPVLALADVGRLSGALRTGPVYKHSACNRCSAQLNANSRNTNIMSQSMSMSTNVSVQGRRILYAAQLDEQIVIATLYISTIKAQAKGKTQSEENRAVLAAVLVLNAPTALVLTAHVHGRIKQ